MNGIPAAAEAAQAGSGRWLASRRPSRCCKASTFAQHSAGLSVRRGTTLALFFGFFVTLVLAWYYGERGGSA